MDDLLKKHVDRCMEELGAEAESILKTKGLAAMEKFVSERVGGVFVKIALEKAPPVPPASPAPLDPETALLQERIEKDLQSRLTGIASNPVLNLSGEEMARGQWNSDPALKAEFRVFEVFLAYTNAIAMGRAKISGSKVVL